MSVMRNTSCGMLLLVLFSSVVMNVSCECQQTHLIYSPYTAETNVRDLNLTFTLLTSKMTKIDPKEQKVGLVQTSTIQNFTVHFHYKDEDQSVSILDNTFVIAGALMQISVDFHWIKKVTIPPSTKQGTATANIPTNSLSYTKILKVTNEFLQFELTELNQMKLQGDLVIKTSTPDMDDALKAQFTKLLNTAINSTSVKQDLQSYLTKQYNSNLSGVVSDYKKSVVNDFTYSWVSPEESAKIDFGMNFTTYNVNPDSLLATLKSQIKDDPQWDCSVSAPTQPYNPKDYGNSQQIITLEIFKNLLRYGIEHDIFDSKLSKANWQSKAFQFYAGDLYDIIPKIKSNFVAKEEVTGLCLVNKEKYSVSLEGQSSFSVLMTHSCYAQIRSVKIIDFDIAITYRVKISAEQRSLVFTLFESQVLNIEINETAQYQVMNKSLLIYFIEMSLLKISNGLVFGTGWPILGNYGQPIFKFMQDKYALIYDRYSQQIQEEA